MNKKALDEKYFYQIDEHNVVHLFRGEDDCQQYLTNPLLSAIFKIETLEKDNAELTRINDNLEEDRLAHIELEERLKKENIELKEKYVKNITDCDICDTYCNSQLIKAKEIIRDFISVAIDYIDKEDKNYSFIIEAEQFLKETEE